MFIDESGIRTNYTPIYGWSKKGDECLGEAPAKWKSYTMLSSLDYNGETQTLFFEGAVNKAIFREFMEEILLPILKPGQIIVMDNLNIHKNSFNKDLFLDKGIKILYLPRYSPDLNPIEMMWSKIKNLLRKAKERNFLGLWREMSLAHMSVTPQDAQGWYHACGYSH